MKEDEIPRTPGKPKQCDMPVWETNGWHTYVFQCTRRAGYGADGAYCKQHARIMERREART